MGPCDHAFIATADLQWLCLLINAHRFSTRWISRQTGQAAGSRPWVPPVPPERDAAIRALARDVAGCSHGDLYRLRLPMWGTDKEAARRAGIIGAHPFACYTATGQLVPGSIRNEPVERRKHHRTQTALKYIHVIEWSLEGYSAAEIAARIGQTKRYVSRVRATAGLRFTEAATAAWDPIVVAPGYAARAAEIRAALTARSYDYDPYEFARAIGLMADRHWQIPETSVAEPAETPAA